MQQFFNYHESRKGISGIILNILNTKMIFVEIIINQLYNFEVK